MYWTLWSLATSVQWPLLNLCVCVCFVSVWFWRINVPLLEVINSQIQSGVLAQPIHSTCSENASYRPVEHLCEVLQYRSYRPIIRWLLKRRCHFWSISIDIHYILTIGATPQRQRRPGRCKSIILHRYYFAQRPKLLKSNACRLTLTWINLSAIV